MSDAEYNALAERVAKGKELLEGKWGSTDYETREWIDIWFDLSDMLFEQMKLRGVFKESLTFEQIKNMQEATLARVQEQMIAKGYIKRPKGKKTRAVEGKKQLEGLFE